MLTEFIKKIIFVLILAIAVFLSAVSYTIVASDKDLIDSMAKQQMDNISQKILEKIKSYLNDAAKLNDEISLFFYRKYLTPANRGEVIEVFDSFRNIHPQFKNIYFGTFGGKMIISPPHPPKVAAKYDPRKRPWFKTAKRAEKQIWTDVYTFASTGELGLTVAKPIVINGDREGVLGMDINLKELSHFLRGFQLEPAGYAFIADKNNVIIAHPIHTYVMKNIKDLNLDINLNDLATLDENKSLFIYGKNNFVEIARYQDANYKWTVGVVVSRTSNVFNLRYVLLIVGIFSLGMIGIAIFILWLMKNVNKMKSA